jgi:hypothetical protein
MPIPTDEKLLALSQDVLAQFDTIFGLHPGFRPAHGKGIMLGRFVLTALAPENARAQKKIIFDPIPRVDGIKPSEDPPLELRAAVYLLSGRRRRQASE